MKLKRTIAKVIAIILATAMTAGLCSCSNISPTETQRETSAEVEETTETEEITETIEETKVESSTDAVPDQESFVRQSGVYVTYPYKSATFLESVPNDCAYGTDVKCTAMQGMAASENYLYVAKQRSDKYANIYQYDPDSDKLTMMKYFDDLEASEQTALDCVCHCNDMTIYTDSDNQQYLLAATMYQPNSKAHPVPCLAQFQLNEENAELRLAGYFNITKTNSEGEKSYLSVGSIRMVAQTEGYNYFLIKLYFNFYWCKIPVGTVGGTKENPIEIPCVQLFDINNRNAVFVDEYGNLKTMTNLESWTNQGFFYSPEEDLLYVPHYNSYNGAFAGSESVIVTYDMEGMMTPERLEAVKENQNPEVYPATLAFYLLVPSQSVFEIESCVLMRNQGDDGNLKLYFNTNAKDVSNYEGIWSYEYTRGCVEVQPIVGEDTVIYEIEYHYNVDGISESDWTQDVKNHYYNMSRGSTHIKGITTNLRINCFIREGAKFLGWTLYRTSDDKWLYTDGNWYTEQEAPEGLVKRIVRDAEPVDDLTDVNGDIITAYAQWI